MPRHNIASVGPSIDGVEGDRMRRAAARQGSDSLLRAQLRAGQHLLPIHLANALGDTLGMRPGSVRAAAGDPTSINGGRL